MTKRKPRVILSHTTQRPTQIHLYFDKFDDEIFVALGWQIGSEEEKDLYGDDGPFQAWDNDIVFDDEKKAVVISGNDGPGGGPGCGVVITVPYNLITGLTFEHGPGVPKAEAAKRFAELKKKIGLD
jgi:hypothetical protein